ncbi:unnamed protein product [Ilex paraguariensis]|uniref:Eukaryotic initiation factor 4A n=1 Tax=Ilex paraguariensis TaxID=185542 RepID=A0ABC8TAP0_9AQUA
MDATEAASPTSHSPSNFSQQRHFYLAVDRLQFKMETLVDLLGMAGRRPCLPIVVCCSTRDELDAVCSAVSNLSYISIASLCNIRRFHVVWLLTWHASFSPVSQYSDLADAERAVTLDKFRQATVKWNQNATVKSGDGRETVEEEQKSNMIVVTDACLPLVASGESPISARVLINYELPAKKETYTRRMATCLAADGIVINMVVGGEVVTLKHVEETSSLVIAEMPINIFEML